RPPGLWEPAAPAARDPDRPARHVELHGLAVPQHLQYDRLARLAFEREPVQVVHVEDALARVRDDLVTGPQPDALPRPAAPHVPHLRARRAASGLEVTLVLRIAELRAQRLLDRRHFPEPGRITGPGGLVLRLELPHLQLRRALLDPLGARNREAGVDETLDSPLLE